MKDIHRGEGNSNMGLLLFAMVMWKSHATKDHVTRTSGKLTFWKGKVRLVGCRPDRMAAKFTLS